MRRYPPVIIVCCFASGIFLQSQFEINSVSILLGVCVIAILCAQFTAKHAFGSVLIAVTICMFGWILAEHHQAKIRAVNADKLGSFQKVDLIGELESEPYFSGNTYLFDVAIQQVRINSSVYSEMCKVRVSTKFIPDSLLLGEQLFIRGHWLWPKNPAYPGGFDYGAYLKAHDIVARVMVRKDGFVARFGSKINRFHLPRYYQYARGHVWQTIVAVADAQAAPVLRGLLIGDRRLIDEDIVESFVQVGIIHVLAISGLHVGFIAAIFLFLFRLMRIPLRYSLLLMLLCIWLFAGFTGMKPPVFRASIMVSLFVLAKIRDRQLINYNILATAAIIILAVQPMQLFQLGFQLSFAAVFGILYFYPKFEKTIIRQRWLRHAWHRVWGVKYILGLFCVTVSAQIGTTPVLLLHTGKISFAALVANVPVIPTIFLTICAAIAALVVFPFSLYLAEKLGWLASRCVEFVIQISQSLATYKWASLDYIFPEFNYVLAAMGVLFAITQWKHNQRRFLFLTLALGAIVFQIWNTALSSSDDVIITILDIGQGDCAVVEMPNGDVLIIDGGPVFPGYDPGEKVIFPFLKRHGIDEVDAIMVSHPHLDHYGGFITLAKIMKINTAIFADTTYDSKLFKNFIHGLKAQGTQIQIVEKGDVLTQFDPVQLFVLGPNKENANIERNWNQASLVIKLQYGNSSALFTGDTEKEGEVELVHWGEFLVSDLLKVGHHGSKTSSTIEFLQTVSPKMSSISAGIFNKYEHPSVLTLTHLDSLKVNYFRTDLDGAIQFALTGEKIRLID